MFALVTRNPRPAAMYNIWPSPHPQANIRLIHNWLFNNIFLRYLSNSRVIMVKLVTRFPFPSNILYYMSQIHDYIESPPLLLCIISGLLSRFHFHWIYFIFHRDHCVPFRGPMSWGTRLTAKVRDKDNDIYSSWAHCGWLPLGLGITLSHKVSTVIIQYWMAHAFVNNFGT